MTLNYRETGKNPAIPAKFLEGVESMNKHAELLRKAGLLPRKFPNDPRLTQSQSILNENLGKIGEESDAKEISTLESYINSIRQAVSGKDEGTMAGFAELRQILNERYARMLPISGIEIEAILQFFNKSVEQYKNNPKNLYTRGKKSGRKIYYRGKDRLDPRQMRVLIFYYNLLPGIAKNPITIAYEEEISGLEGFRSTAERQIAINL